MENFYKNYDNIKKIINLAYKKLKANIYFDKNNLNLKHKLATYDENNLKNFSDIITNLVYDFDNSAWEKFQEKILDEVSVIALPKTTKRKSEYINEHNKVNGTDDIQILFNKINEQIVVDKCQYYADLSIEANIIGVIWTMFIGSAIDSSYLMYEHAYANRINQTLVFSDSPKLFQPYFSQYESWRDNALDEAKKCLDKNEDVVILTMDFERYFYSVDITKKEFDAMFQIYLKSSNILRNELIHEFEKEFNELLLKINDLVYKIIVKYSQKLKDYSIGDIDIDKRNVLPIGFSPSMVVGNWILKDFDKSIINNINPIYYGRYVDDIIFVDKIEKNSDLYKLAKSGKLTSTAIFKKYFLSSLDRETNSENFSSILKFKENKEDSSKSYYYLSSNVISGNSGIKLQQKKVKIFYFAQGTTTALIDSFRKQIAQNASAFNFLPNIDYMICDNDFDEFFKIIREGSLNKFNGIKNFEFDKYGASKALGKIVKVSSAVNDLNQMFFIEKILNIFDEKLYIENFAFWERIFEILIINKKFDSLTKMFKKIFKTIKGLLMRDSDNVEFKNYNFINNMLSYLKYSLCRPLSLLGKHNLYKLLNNIKSEISVISADSKICNEWYVNLCIIEKDIYSYRHTRMFNKYLVPINYEFINSSNTEIALFDFSSLVKKIKSVTNICENKDQYLYLPYIVTPQEISFAIKCSECENNESFEERSTFTIIELYKLLNFSEHNKDLDGIVKVKKPKKDNIKKIIVKSSTKSNVEGFKFKIAIGNADVDEKNITELLRGKKNLTYSKYQEIISLINQAIKEKANLLVLPECYVPFEWVPILSNICAKNQIALICGLEYYVTSENEHINNRVYNFTAVILPYEGKTYKYAHVEFHHKKYYSPHEKEEILANCQIPVEGNNYELYEWRGIYFTVYCCYELASIKDRAIFMNMIDLFVAVEWNKDINYYSNIIESLSRDLHCYCVQVNSSNYGDSRIVQPSCTEKMNIIKTKGGKNKTILVDEIDIKQLRDFQKRTNGGQKSDNNFKLTPPGFDHESPYKREFKTINIDLDRNKS